MSMHKIFFGTIVFFSLAFLAACGGSGGSGSTGAAGAAGSDGTDGTISVPSADSNLDIVYADPDDAIDNNTALGTVTQDYIVIGLDNTSAMDNRQMYYAYEGTSATAKAAILNAAGGTLAFTGGGINTSSTAGIIDPREMLTDNLTLTMASYVASDDDGSITHMIICPGNEAGDAASCASEALEDRGARPSGNVDLGFDLVPTTAGDVYMRAFILPKSSTSGNDMILVGDNGTHTVGGSLTMSKTTYPSYGSVLSATASNKVNMPGYMSDNITDVVVGGSNVYTTAVSTTDNATILIKVIGTGAMSTYDTVAYSDIAADNNSQHFSLSWDPVGSALYGAGTMNNDSSVTGGLTVMTYALDGSSTSFSDNFTVDNVSHIQGGAWCFAAGSPTRAAGGTAAPEVLLLSRNDNNTWLLQNSGPADGVAVTAADPYGISDNYTGGVTGLEYGISDNYTNVHCDIAWNFSTSSSSVTGQDNGTIHLAMMDNASAVRVGIIGQDNTSSIISGILAGTGSGIITDIEIGVDSGDNKSVLAVLKGGSYYLLKQDAVGTGFDTIIAGTAAGGTSGKLSLSVSPDGAVYAVAVDGSNDNTSIRVFYDE